MSSRALHLTTAILVALALPSSTILITKGIHAMGTAADIIRTEDGASLALIACTIRNSGAGWEILETPTHVASNCTGVVQEAGRLKLLHPCGAYAVASLQVTPDETYAQQAIRVGVSAGLDYSYIYLYSGAPGGAAKSPASLVSASGNLWVQGYLRLPS